MMNNAKYEVLLSKLVGSLDVLQDKPEESPVNTLRALWYTAVGEPKSALTAGEEGDLPPLSNEQEQKLRLAIEQRLKGVPLAHITGRQQFMGIELLAGPQALIPRKETELLAESSLELMHKNMSSDGELTIIDVCTGNGNLAISHAVHEPRAKVYATDICADAAHLARKNIEFKGLSSRVVVFEGDLLAPFDGAEFINSVDLITCNPPYISSSKIDEMPSEIASHEPRLAFDGGVFGIKILQKLINQAPRYLRTGGWLAFEVGEGQGPAIMQRLNRNKNYKQINSAADVEGEMRVIMAEYRA